MHHLSFFFLISYIMSSLFQHIFDFSFMYGDRWVNSITVTVFVVMNRHYTGTKLYQKPFPPSPHDSCAYSCGNSV